MFRNILKDSKEKKKQNKKTKICKKNNKDSMSW